MHAQAEATFYPPRRNSEYWHGFVSCGNVAVAFAILMQIVGGRGYRCILSATPSAMPSLAFGEGLRCCGKFAAPSPPGKCQSIAPKIPRASLCPNI